MLSNSRRATPLAAVERHSLVGAERGQVVESDETSGVEPPTMLCAIGRAYQQHTKQSLGRCSQRPSPADSDLAIVADERLPAHHGQAVGTDEDVRQRAALGIVSNVAIADERLPLAIVQVREIDRALAPGEEDVVAIIDRR